MVYMVYVILGRATQKSILREGCAGGGDSAVNGKGLDWVNGVEVEWATGFQHIINGRQN
jgi:hypothetical protein